MRRWQIYDLSQGLYLLTRADQKAPEYWTSSRYLASRFTKSEAVTKSAQFVVRGIPAKMHRVKNRKELTG